LPNGTLTRDLLKTPESHPQPEELLKMVEAFKVFQFAQGLGRTFSI